MVSGGMQIKTPAKLLGVVQILVELCVFFVVLCVINNLRMLHRVTPRYHRDTQRKIKFLKQHPCWFATGVVNKEDFKFDLRFNRISLPAQHNYREPLQSLY